MFKVNRNTRTRRCEVCSKLTIKTLERRHWHGSGVFMVNFLLLTLNRQMPTGEFNNQKDGWYLRVQSQHWKHQSSLFRTIRNLVKANNDTRTHYSDVSIVNFDQVNDRWIQIPYLKIL